MKKTLLIVLFTVVLGLALSCAQDSEKKSDAPAVQTEQTAPADTMTAPADTMTAPADSGMVK